MRISIVSFLILSTQAAICVAQRETPVDSVVVERLVVHRANRIPITKRRVVPAPSAALDPLRSRLEAAGFNAASSDSASTLAACSDQPPGLAISVYSRGEVRRVIVADDCAALSNDVDVAATLRQVGFDVLRGPIRQTR